MRVTEMLRSFHREESGQDLLEYALVLFAVLVAVLAGSTSLASTISNALSTLNTKIESVIS